MDNLIESKLRSSIPDTKLDGFLEFVEYWELTGKDVAMILLGWGGIEILDGDFVEHLESKGYYNEEG